MRRSTDSGGVATQKIDFIRGGKTFALLNETQELDYFGDIDDISVLSIREVDASDIHSHIVNGKLVETPTAQVIEDIVIINDTETMAQSGEVRFKYSFTAAIIFVLPDQYVVFDRDTWFSEDILIYRRPDAINKIKTADQTASPSDTLDVHMDREVLHLASAQPLPNH